MKKEISDNEIEKLENRLGVALPTELKQFYKKFGVADIGENLQELNEIDWLKNLWEEGYGPEFSEEEEEILPYLITFSDYLGNGNMFCFHSETKHIYYYDHDTFPLLYKIFDNVSIYIQCCLIFAQVELLGGVEEDEIMEWTEDIVTDLIGYHKVKKWRY